MSQHEDEHNALNRYIGATATMLTMQIMDLTDKIRIARCVEILREFHVKFPSDCTARCLEEYDESKKGE